MDTDEALSLDSEPSVPNNERVGGTRKKNSQGPKSTTKDLLVQILAELEAFQSLLQDSDSDPDAAKGNNNEVLALIKQESEINYDVLQEIKYEVLAQATLATQVYQLSEKSHNLINRITKSTTDVTGHLEALSEPISKLQVLQQLQSGRQRRQPVAVPSQFNLKSVGLLLVAQSLLVAIVTAFTVYFFPLGANLKAQQQWYAIFQRVDQLYRDEQGSKK